jgi:transcriptional regulator with XRE-family HTH domain
MNNSPLRIARITRGWTQAEFAKRLSIDRTTLSRVETGFVKPGPDLRRRIAGVLGIMEESLFPKD